MNIKNIFEQLRTGTPFVSIPESLPGLRATAAFAERIVSEKFSSCFWNTPKRENLSDAQFLSMVIAVLKKRCGSNGIGAALEIICFLEAENADEFSKKNS